MTGDRQSQKEPKGPPSGASPRRLLISTAEVAALLTVSVRHLRRLHASGKVPAPVKVGAAIRWNREEIERWVAAGCPDRATWEVLNSR